MCQPIRSPSWAARGRLDLRFQHCSRTQRHFSSFLRTREPPVGFLSELGRSFQANNNSARGCVIIPSDNMQIIEDLHLSIAHASFRVIRARMSEVKTKVLAAKTWAESAGAADDQERGTLVSR